MNHHTIVAKSGKWTMEARRSRTLCKEIYEIINSVNSSFMIDVFRLRV